MTLYAPIAAARSGALLDAVRALVPIMQDRAAVLDAAAAFPTQDLADLAAAGLLAAPLPAGLGGLDAGTGPAGTELVRRLLRLCGRGNPSIARLFEAHINALRLIVRYGSAAQALAASVDVRAGHLFGLWVTDAPGSPLRIAAGRLSGRKGPCSGAGHCTRAVVTAADDDGNVWLVAIALSGHETVDPVRGLHGMRAAANGTVTLDGVAATPEAVLGRPGDYLAEPDFSCGAWRTSAATLGALDALLDAAARHLVRRGQDDAPLQQARFGQALIARETARLWVAHAAAMAEQGEAMPDARVAAVNLSRIAIESACLDALRHVQRSLGLAGFVAPHPAERLARDIATYLRQPAPDAVLLEAAAWHLRAMPC